MIAALWLAVQVMSAAARQAAFFAARDERMERDRSERSGEQRADDWAVPLTAALAWPLPELLEPDDASALLPLDDEDEDGASASEGLETMVQDVLDEAAESIFRQADGAGDGEGEQGGSKAVVARASRERKAVVAAKACSRRRRRGCGGRRGGTGSGTGARRREYELKC